MVTIACVYYKQEENSLYTDEWFSRFYKMVERHITVPHRFVCLSNTEVPCERIPLKHNWEGWWSKIELFRPGVFDDSVFYLDLDTIITTNIDDIVSHGQSFVALRPFNPTKAKCPQYFASGLLGWDASGDYDFIYKEYVLSNRNFRGDQDYMSYAFFEQEEECQYWQDLFPGIMSYKRNIFSGKTNGVTPRIVCFHGKPRPWEVLAYENIIGK